MYTKVGTGYCMATLETDNVLNVIRHGPQKVHMEILSQHKFSFRVESACSRKSQQSQVASQRKAGGSLRKNINSRRPTTHGGRSQRSVGTPTGMCGIDLCSR
jgi:hypothetical protein